MKITKFNRRFRLGKEGFFYGFTFLGGYNHQAGHVERILYNMCGREWRDYSWSHHSSDYAWGTCRNEKSRDYYIGVRDKAIMTAVLLALENV